MGKITYAHMGKQLYICCSMPLALTQQFSFFPESPCSIVLLLVDPTRSILFSTYFNKLVMLYVLK